MQSLKARPLFATLNFTIIHPYNASLALVGHQYTSISADSVLSPFLTWTLRLAEPVAPVSVIVAAYMTGRAAPGVESVHGGLVPSDCQRQFM